MLNKAKGNMYDFVTHTWNPIKGLCPHGCSYCYMNTLYARFHMDKETRFKMGKGIIAQPSGQELEFHGANKFIFVCSSTDLFAEEYPKKYIGDIVLTIMANPLSTYLLHTKNPARLLKHIDAFPLNTRFCVTLESNREYPVAYNKAPPIKERVEAFAKINRGKMITIEPIMDFDLEPFVQLIKDCGNVQKVNIGANTNRSVKLPEPSSEKL